MEVSVMVLEGEFWAAGFLTFLTTFGLASNPFVCNGLNHPNRSNRTFGFTHFEANSLLLWCRIAEPQVVLLLTSVKTKVRRVRWLEAHKHWSDYGLNLTSNKVKVVRVTSPQTGLNAK